MATSFLSLYRWLVPGWLADGADGERTLSSLSAMVDVSVERVRQGLLARFPSRAGGTALALIGEDRGIQRGRNEIDEHYAQRLKGWRYPRGHRVRGSAYALLSQISGYFGGIACWTIDAKGSKFSRSASGAESVTRGNAWTWDSLPVNPHWSRFWVVLDGSRVFGEHATLPTENDAAVGQTGATASDVAAIRRLFIGRAWRPAGTQPEWVIASLDGVFPTPDNTWSSWYKLGMWGTAIPSRPYYMRFWSLAPSWNNTFAGDSTRFATSMNLVEAGSYAGDPSDFPTSITLPNGIVHAGDPTKFPTSISLPDDGSRF